LLELAEPISSTSIRFTDSPLKQGARLRAVGVQEKPGSPSQLTVAEIPVEYERKGDASGTALHVQVDGGALPGYSGGPIIVTRWGASSCIGVTNMGRYSTSSFAIGMGHIQAFVPKHIPLDIRKVPSYKVLAVLPATIVLAVGAVGLYDATKRPNVNDSAAVSSLLVRPGPDGLFQLASRGSIQVFLMTKNGDVVTRQITPDKPRSVLVGESKTPIPEGLLTTWRKELSDQRVNGPEGAKILGAWKQPQFFKLPAFKAEFASQAIKVELRTVSGALSECGTIEPSKFSGPVADLPLQPPPC
jgi:hypothetical protein